MSGTGRPPHSPPDSPSSEAAHRAGQVRAVRQIDALLAKLAAEFGDADAIALAHPDLPREVIEMMRAAVGGLFGSARALIKAGAHVPDPAARVRVVDKAGAEWVVAKR